MWQRDGFPFGAPTEQLRYVFCVSRYPTAPWELSGMPQRFGSDGYYGYSDHCLGNDACVLAVARGARYVEKHFTLDKTSPVIRDHVLSANADELRQLVSVCQPLGRLVAQVGALAERSAG
jgi:sialic acid synthase SpsE